MPDDIKIRSIKWQYYHNCFDICVESEQFEEIGEGNCPEVMSTEMIAIEIPVDTHEIIKEKTREAKQAEFLRADLPNEAFKSTNLER